MDEQTTGTIAPWTQVQALCARVEALERLVRQRAGTVEAQRFVLRDERGQVRASLELRDGNPQLGLFDAGGRMRATLGVMADGSVGLALQDAEGRAQAAMGVMGHVPDWFALLDRDEMERTGLANLAGHTGHLVLTGANGQSLVVAPEGRCC